MEVTNFYNYGTMNEVEAGATQINNYYAAQPDSKKQEEGKVVDMMTVVKALEKCKPSLWGYSALATIFCVCRDEYNYEDNMSLFERQMELLGVECPAGTLANAMRNNNYMKLPVSKWKQNGAQERALKLVEEFKKSVEEVQAEEIPT